MLKIYGPKAEDAYIRAQNRVLSGKPSQLGKALVDDICPGELKFVGCHCDRIVWGMFREKIPIVIRNHIADLAFNKDTYEAIFDKADQVFDSNSGPEPLPQRSVVAAVSNSDPEVAAVQKPKPKFQKDKNKNKDQSSGNQNQTQNSGQNSSQERKQPKTPTINSENLCRIHAKWKNNATFCAAPWGCKMKNVYKAPQ